MVLTADRPLNGNRILLAVSGSVAASRADEVRRALRDAGASIQILLTEAGERFFPERTAGALTDHPVLTDERAWNRSGDMLHITAKQESDLMLVAPATANRMLQLESPRPADLLGTVLHAFSGPVFYAPAMNPEMWNDPMLQEIVEANHERIVMPEGGTMACGEEGVGRLAEPPRIVEFLVRAAWPDPLEGQHWIVSAGGTREAWDDVRVLTNRSSGRMGEAMARIARRLGASVSLVTTADRETYPGSGIEYVPVESADEMKQAVAQRAGDAVGYVGAAAVANFRPVRREGKVRSSEEPVIELEPADNILGLLAEEHPDLRRIGFAVEPAGDDNRIRAKLSDHDLDLLVVNYLEEQPFGSDSNRVELVYPDRPTVSLPRRSKSEIALQIWSHYLS